MGDTRRDYREWIRVIGLNITNTPKALGLPGGIAGQEALNQAEPSNYQIDMAIASACRVVCQQVNLADSGPPRTVPVPVQTTNGPMPISLGYVPGLKDRSLISIRRFWWYDGTTSNLLQPFILSDADNRNNPYLNDAPAVPMRYAIEGYNLYLDPAPGTAGYIQFMAGCGVLNPQSDDESYDQIPETYDQNVNLIALQFLAKTDATDVTMKTRAELFAPDAAAGLERLKAWFNGGSNEEVQAVCMFDATALRRFRRRWR